MKVAFERRAFRNELQKRLTENEVDIDADATNLKLATERNLALQQIRWNFASSRIQGLIRGFLARCQYADLKIKYRASIAIQRIARGRLGRLKWRKKYWWTRAVVKSKEALEDLIARSRVVRQVKSESMPSYHWQECFDPMTHSFWYLNRWDMGTTWDCPMPLQKDLVCTWDDSKFAPFRGSTSASLVQHDDAKCGQCRCVFTTVMEFHSHLQNAHRWWCPACEHRNWGASFPTCTLCGNNRGTDGEDATQALKESVEEMRKKLDTFLRQDFSNASSEKYTIRGRLVELARERRDRLEKFGFADEDVEWHPVQPAELLAQAKQEQQKHDRLSNAGSTLAKSIIQSLPAPLLYEEQSTTTISSGRSITSISLASTQGYPPAAGSEVDPTANPVSTTTDSSALKKRVTISEPQVKKDSLGSASSLFPSLTKKESLISTGKKMSTITIANNGQSGPTPSSSANAPKAPAGEVPQSKPPTQKKGLRANKVPIPVQPMFSTEDDIEDYRNQQNELAQIKRTRATLHPRLDSRVEKDRSDCLPPSYGTVTSKAAEAEFNSKGGTAAEESKLFSDPLGCGVLFGEEFGEVIDDFVNVSTERAALRAAFLRAKRKQEKAMKRSGQKGRRKNRKSHHDDDGAQEDNDDGLSSSDDDDDSDARSGTEKNQQDENISWMDITGEMRMLVCKKFLLGKCSQSTCPMAHPGVRDSSVAVYARPPGGGNRKVPLVRVCENYDAFCDNCENGKLCKKYHIYVRPSTEEIIRRIYPLEKGQRSKQFLSGAKLMGNVAHREFNGYGVMTWPSKAVYMGDWKDGQRHGLGIYRSPDGVEYAGAWENGCRHGQGVLTTANGDEYIGEWAAGKMEGVGRLSNRNGDVYEGGFYNNKYHGVCSFIKSNGDKYIGHCKDGMASGIGILVLNNGEKYKGNFDRNFRHGKGVCAYKNGSRYAGEWYRGHPNGFGIYLSPIGEKYIGEWSATKKHGKGRYYFINGDFYDGEFFKDKAKGYGVYYHANGNIYVGNWENDKRNGRGTYVFNTGSKYTGYWVDNNIHGKGKLDYGGGSFYRGEFHLNKKHGKGVFTWPNGTSFKGYFDGEVIHGFGECTYWNGHRYVGNWANNKKNGRGMFFYQKGHVYEGDWLDDVRHGKGKMTWLPGTVIEESYEGDWDNDERHGHGVYRYRTDEGTVYDGSWIRGVRHGRGLITYKDGSYYRGDFQKEQMWGKGVYVGKDGSQYDGEWRANMRHGIGTVIYNDGSIYHGEFRANMKHGSGKMTDRDGCVFTGHWEANVPLGKGTYTLLCGEGPAGGPEEVKIRVIAL